MTGSGGAARDTAPQSQFMQFDQQGQDSKTSIFSPGLKYARTPNQMERRGIQRK